MKVGGAKDTIVHNFVQPRPLWVKPRPFCMIEVTVQCTQELLERTYSNSSRVNLAAAYCLLIITSESVYCNNTRLEIHRMLGAPPPGTYAYLCARCISCIDQNCALSMRMSSRLPILLWTCVHEQKAHGLHK